jgi:hypothetical protein
MAFMVWELLMRGCVYVPSYVVAHGTKQSHEHDERSHIVWVRQCSAGKQLALQLVIMAASCNC